MRRKREWRAGGEKRLNPPEGNVNVQMAHVWVWLKVEGHLSSFREHPSDAELGVFYHFPWQLAPKAQVWIQQELVLRAPSFKRGPGGCDLLTVISEFSTLYIVDISKWTSALARESLERTSEVLHRVWHKVEGHLMWWCLKWYKRVWKGHLKCYTKFRENVHLKGYKTLRV